MLTASQYKTFQFIEGFIQDHGYAPTIAEIALGLGLKSRSAIHRNLQAIATEGLINLTPQRKRNIELVNTCNTSLPIIGCIAAGSPIEAIHDRRSLDITYELFGPERYLLEVKGDSMIGDNICEGDLVLCERRSHVRDGDIIVALIDHQEATLKRFYRNKDETVSLCPSNPRLSPMVYHCERVEVQGVYLGLIRLEGRS